MTFKLMGPFILVAALGACGDRGCTEAELQTKLTGLMTKLQSVAMSDPQKLVTLQPKVFELQQQAASGSRDLDAACKAVDELTAELEG